MIDINRLDELYAAAITQLDHPSHSDYRDWIHGITDAWPAVAAELTRLLEARELLTELRAKLAEHGIEGSPPVGGSVFHERDSRLALLEEFARDCRDNYDCDSDSHKYDTRCRACEAAKVLDAEIKKVGE